MNELRNKINKQKVEIQKLNQPKNRFSEKINKMGTPLARPNKETEELQQIL